MELWRKQHAYILRRFVVDQGDHGGRSSFVLISMITSVLAEASGPRICQGVRSPGDGRHREPRQASAVTPAQFNSNK
jgi:hypothetical protein